MEFRGNEERSKGRLAITRRSKIDDIAKSVDGIKHLLEGLNVSPDVNQPKTSYSWQLNQLDSAKPLAEQQPTSTTGGEPQWDHSVHIIDFVKAVVEDAGLRNARPEESEVLSSLRNLIQALEGPAVVRDSTFPEIKVARYQNGPPMPPLEAVVAVLRWAKDHEEYTRLVWVSRILPLDKFAEICRNVYFAVDDYSEVDLIIANGYLSYIFSEHVVISGLQDYREYCLLCRKNLHSALSRLPLLLPASMEVIAALTLGAFNAIENSKATMGWTFISAASDLCQRLGYHRPRPRESAQPLRAAQERLFWTVYRFDKGLSLRLGRLSNISDAEIMLSIDPDELRSTRVGRIQGKVYDQLYSPAGLSRPDTERGYLAEILAGELRELINETHDEIFDATAQPSGREADPMRVVYLQCDLVCQSSLLVLIMRAVPTNHAIVNCVSDECVAVARETLDKHHRCMMDLRSCVNDPFMVPRYISWAILHTPFVPFSILFTRAVQLLDVTDLGRLEGFAASLRPEATSPEPSTTHPYRLYELLSQAARLYIDSNMPLASADQTLPHGLPESLTGFDFAQFGMEVGVTANETLEANGAQAYELSDWYYGNRQIMSLLDEDVMFWSHNGQ
ncbi:hypothetical protein F4677DRAFT_443364 [Hypoxylon crocopeplum]|nr:hypothetical protein F4677DRAFT_443364 [Hypoxylon crocopeplum]